jgi:hypothetical protein
MTTIKEVMPPVYMDPYPLGYAMLTSVTSNPSAVPGTAENPIDVDLEDGGTADDTQQGIGVVEGGVCYPLPKKDSVYFDSAVHGTALHTRGNWESEVYDVDTGSVVPWNSIGLTAGVKNSTSGTTSGGGSTTTTGGSSGSTTSTTSGSASVKDGKYNFYFIN